MKRILLTLLCVPMIGFGQQTYVPDNNFEAYLEANNMGNDIWNDDYVTTENINTVTFLDVAGLSIIDLTGIEDFTALTYLSCLNNQITSFDISNNTALEVLYCYMNELTSLDVSQNTALTELHCLTNQLTSLDVSQNTALNTLSCSGNQITSLDVSQNTALKVLYCTLNSLTTLDVSQNTALTNLGCGQNQLTSLDVSINTNLTALGCFHNQLTSLDVSQNTALTELWCFVNQLTSLDVRNGNNANFLNFKSLNNPNLYCIDVDDTAWANTNWTVANENIDSETSFSENCANSLGCTAPLACNYDSIATINDGSCAYSEVWQQVVSICNGDNITVGNSVYDTTGNYIDTLTSSNGCDSTVYTDITINYNTSSYDTLSVTSSIVWNEIPLNLSGDYSVTLFNFVGCDSIANLNLTITTTGILEIIENKDNLVKITNLLGQETKAKKNEPLIYIYDDGTVEKRIVIE
tara:strand:- start:158 stop:1552 length:1395 start_codon:yes stop_codon:yes gene_type:complete